jgi:hypothetical protein
MSKEITDRVLAIGVHRAICFRIEGEDYIDALKRGFDMMEGPLDYFGLYAAFVNAEPFSSTVSKTHFLAHYRKPFWTSLEVPSLETPKDSEYHILHNPAEFDECSLCVEEKDDANDFLIELASEEASKGGDIQIPSDVEYISVYELLGE